MTASPSPLITLFLGGDLMAGRGVDQILPQSCPPNLFESYVRSALGYVALAEKANGPIPRPVPYEYVWGDLLQTLADKRPSVTIVNLETSVTTSESAVPKSIHYRMHPDNVALLSSAGIDCCVLANNHVLDWGVEGLRETLDTLAAAGIRFAGAGLDLESASAPALLNLAPGSRVLVFAFGFRDSGILPTWAAGNGKPGVHLLPDFSSATVRRLEELVRAWKRPGDVAVASVHWGSNWGFQIEQNHQRFARALIDGAGIDVIHGHSSHHSRALEIYRRRSILYGCGELLNDYEGIGGYEEFRSDLVLTYFLTLDLRSGCWIRLGITPFQIRSLRLREPSSSDRLWLLERVSQEYHRFGSRLRLEGNDFVLEPQPAMLAV